MKDSIFYEVVKFYKRIIHGVAFVPLIITFGFIIFGIFLSIIQRETESSGISLIHLTEVKKIETARIILTSILTGMISLTVFSFSMMMVVVNQSSSNFSPKVVEAFMNNRNNQYILGFYLGTIIFTLLAMVQLDSEKLTNGIPKLSLIGSILFSITSILLFVQFINNISNSVRIGSIIERLYKKTKKSLKNGNEFRYSDQKEPQENWICYKANRNGYFQVIRIAKLLKILEKEDLILKVVPLPGYYFTKLSPLFYLNKNISNEKTLEAIRNNFITYTGEDVSENEFFGYRQLREVAVKALSPGINDPGIARICIDYLGDLLATWMTKEQKNIVIDKEGKARIILNKYDFTTLIGICFTPIKAYAKKDYTVLIALLKTIHDLSYYDGSTERKQALIDQVNSILEEADQNIHNSLERKYINSTIKELNQSRIFSFPMLKY